MELTLWEDISNMRWAQLLIWCLLLCTSTTNWKNNSSPRPRILENRCFTDGGIIISRISPLFSAASFLNISITCSEPRSRQYGVALHPTVLPNPLISALLVTVSSRTDHELFAKKLSKFQFLSVPIFSSLCEKISQTCGEPRSCYCSGCFYAIVLPTGKITVL